MHVSGIQEGFYAFSIEEAPDGLSLGGTMYEQFRKPISGQSMRLEHNPVPSEGESLYAFWQRVTRGNKRR
jgi:hypothetical protein